MTEFIIFFLQTDELSLNLEELEHFKAYDYVICINLASTSILLVLNNLIEKSEFRNQLIYLSAELADLAEATSAEAL